ncbi:hypothetical protein [Nocardioides sp. KR10-350]|uniref:hypothetical protein n=1 Tax=Nocardioides cheoyonin TaxID=3156615 RepID=UPI0032B5E00D
MAAKPSTPTVHEWPTANVALVISAIAALVALGSFAVACMTYRRAGALIWVSAEIGRIVDTDAGRELFKSITVTVANKGLAAVTVRNVAFEYKSSRWRRWSREALIPVPDDVLVKWPERVEGNSEQSFVYKRAVVQEAADPSGGEVFLRARVSLASGKARRSRAIRLDPL